MFPMTISPADVLLIAIILLAGFFLPASTSVQILLYQGLSGVLVLLTLWTVLTSGNGWGLLLIVIPLGLAVFINPIARYIMGSSSTTTPPLSKSKQLSYFLLGLGLIVLTVIIAPHLPAGSGEISPLRLASALTIVLVGVCIWLVRANLISQAVGLLVMDDGLFLLGESIVHNMGLINTLLAVLFLYLLVPLTCLLLVMPRLRQAFLGLDVDQYRKLRG